MIKLLIVTISLILGLSQISFAESSFGLNPYAAFLKGSAYFNTGYISSGIYLPKDENDESASFSLGFTVPRDPDIYFINRVLVRVIWSSIGSNCYYDLRNNFVNIAFIDSSSSDNQPDYWTRMGNGRVTQSTASLVPTTGNDLIEVWQNDSKTEVGIKEYEIVTDKNGPPPQPGAVVIFGLFRPRSSNSDTCSSPLIIKGIEIVYDASWRGGEIL